MFNTGLSNSSYHALRIPLHYMPDAILVSEDQNAIRIDRNSQADFVNWYYAKVLDIIFEDGVYSYGPPMRTTSKMLYTGGQPCFVLMANPHTASMLMQNVRSRLGMAMRRQSPPTSAYREDGVLIVIMYEPLAELLPFFWSGYWIILSDSNSREEINGSSISRYISNSSVINFWPIKFDNEGQLYGRNREGWLQYVSDSWSHDKYIVELDYISARHSTIVLLLSKPNISLSELINASYSSLLYKNIECNEIDDYKRNVYFTH